MKLSRLFALLFLPVALAGCSEPAPECWSPSVKSLLKDIAKESYNKEIVVVEMEVFNNVTPQRRACSAKLVTKYNEKEGTYQYFEVDYVVRTIRGENDTYYTSVTDMHRKPF